VADFLITYDLKSGSPDAHKPFLTAAEKEGLLYVWKGSDYVNRLPNTTLWGLFESKEAANKAFDRALAAAGRTVGYTVTLEKRATSEMGSSAVNSDKRKAPDPRWTGKAAFETSRRHQVNDPYFK